MKSLIFFFFFSVFLPNAAQAYIPYQEIARYKLGGEGSWDYLTIDEAGERLYIARTNRVMVVNANTGALIGEVPDTLGAHGVALVPKLGLGFATAGKSNSVTIFDTKALKKIAQIEAGEKPDAILYDQASENIFVFNGKGKSVSVIDPHSRKVIATIPLAGKPESAVSDEAGTVFLNLEDTSTLVAIDTKKLAVRHSYALKPCEEPTGLAIDRHGHRLFVGCGNKLAAIVDARSGEVLKTIAVGDGVDAAAFDPKRKLAFIPAREGKLSILQESSKGFALVQDLATQKGARTMALDEKTGKVFLVTAEFGAAKSVVPGTFVVIVLGRE